jgi:ABC-type sugar transport system substrate-binding protein
MADPVDSGGNNGSRADPSDSLGTEPALKRAMVVGVIFVVVVDRSPRKSRKR